MSRIENVITALEELTFAEMMSIADYLSDSYYSNTSSNSPNIKIAYAIKELVDHFKKSEDL